MNECERGSMREKKSEREPYRMRGLPRELVRDNERERQRVRERFNVQDY